MNKSDLSSALSDLELIKEVFEGKVAYRATSRDFLILGALTAVALALLIIELSTMGGVTQNFLVSRADSEFKLSGLIQIFGVTALLTGLIYWLVWNRAKELQATLNRTIGREFKYLAIESFLPDMLLKFTILAAVIWLDTPHLVGPVLTAFVGDYILQGRVFRLPRRLNLILGFSVFGLAFYTIVVGSSSVLPSVVSFVAASGASFVNLYLQRDSHG